MPRTHHRRWWTLTDAMQEPYPEREPGRGGWTCRSLPHGLRCAGRRSSRRRRLHAALGVVDDHRQIGSASRATWPATHRSLPSGGRQRVCARGGGTRVLEADRDPDHEPIARQDQPVGGPEPRGRTARRAPRRPGSSRRPGRGSRCPPVRWRRPAGRNRPRRTRSGRAGRAAQLPAGRPQRRRRPIHENGVAGAGPEQLLVDDADPAADVEDGRAGRAVRRQELEQHPRRLDPVPFLRYRSRSPSAFRRSKIDVNPSGSHPQLSIAIAYSAPPRVSRRPSPAAGRACRHRRPACRAPARWRTSVSLRNALTNRFRSPSGARSCDSRPGWSATSPVTTSRTVPPGTSTCFAPPVATRSVGGMRTVLMPSPPASARRPTGSAGWPARDRAGRVARPPSAESERPRVGRLEPVARSAARRPRRPARMTPRRRAAAAAARVTPPAVSG